MLLTHYIRPADKIKPGEKNGIRFHSKHFYGIMDEQELPTSDSPASP